jgi:uncharacterized protein YpmS
MPLRRQPTLTPCPHNCLVMLAALAALFVFAVLFVVHLRSRAKRDTKKNAPDASSASKFETTLGEFHDMREALRPLQHTRAASRKVPSSGDRPPR